jgi:hypothetical protein
MRKRWRVATTPSEFEDLSAARIDAIFAPIGKRTGESESIEGQGNMIKRNSLGLAFLIMSLVGTGRITFAEGPAVARLVFLSAKPGGKAQMEEAIKRQMDWRREQKDEWHWLTWEYVSGEAGRYAVATFGHAWQDYAQCKVAPWVETLDQESLAILSTTPPMVQYFDHVDDVSAAGTDQGVPTMAEIAVFELQFGKTAQFYQAVRQFHDAMQKAGSSERYEWFELLNGGEGPRFMLFLPRRNWAAFNSQTGFLSEALEKSLGKKKSEKLIAQFGAAVKSYHRSAVRLRPDLSKLGPTETVK